MVAELHQALLARDDAPAVVEESVADSPTNGQAYVALTGSDMYHRADCSMVASKPNSAMLAPSTIRKRNLTPCPLCEPSLIDAP
jgi:hypothetical protein